MGPEDLLESSLRDFVDRAVRHPGHLVSLGHRRGRKGHPALERANQRMDLLLDDEPLGLGHADIGLATGITEDEPDLAPPIDLIPPALLMSSAAIVSAFR